MAFGEEKFIEVLTTILGLNFTNYKIKHYSRLYKCYSFMLMVILFVLSAWSISGKLKIAKGLTLQLELLISIVGLATIVASVILDVFLKNKKIQYLRKSVEKYLQSIDLEEEYKLQQTNFFIKLVAVNVIFAFLSISYISTITYVTSWSVSQYFVIDMVNMYIIAMVIMHINNYTLFLVFASKTVNAKLVDLMNPFKKGRNEEVVEIKAIAKFHIVLCDLITNLNKAIGFRVLLILLYTSFLILQFVEIMMHDWHSSVLLNAPKVLIILLSCTLLVCTYHKIKLRCINTIIIS